MLMVVKSAKTKKQPATKEPQLSMSRAKFEAAIKRLVSAPPTPTAGK